MPANVTLSISDGTVINAVPYTQNMTARKVLEAAYDMSVNPPTMPQISFWIDYYGQMNNISSYLVTLINGTAQMGDQYWFLYVNNVLMNTGVDDTIINDGDQVLFTYEAYNPAVHGQTLIHRLRSQPGVLNRVMATRSPGVQASPPPQPQPEIASPATVQKSWFWRLWDFLFNR